MQKGKDGGQIAITDEIENYPGQIVEGESGPSLIARMTQQVENGFGAERVTDVINSVELDGDVKKLKSAKAEYLGKNSDHCNRCILHVRLDAKTQKEFIGKRYFLLCNM